jgi:hypothetical protein
MKSQQQENNITKTSCKDCIFSVYHKNTQTGCLVDRIETYKNIDKDLVIEAYDNEKEFFVVNRFCNYYQNSSWNNGIPDTNKIRNQAKVSFNIIVDCKDFGEKEINNLINFYEYIVDYNLQKVDFKIYINKCSGITNIFDIRSQFNNPEITVYFDKFNPHDELIKTKKSYTLILNKENVENDLNMLEKLNDLVNSDLKKVIVLEYKNLLIISNLAYKIQSLISESTNYELIVNKILDESKQNGYYFNL